MVVFDLTSLRVYVTLFLVLAVLDVTGAESEGPSKKDGEDGYAKDMPTEDVKDIALNDLPKEGSTHRDAPDGYTHFLSLEEFKKLQNITDEEEFEKKKVFITAKEGCDFLGFGSLFDKPDYHLDLLHDYQTMEQFGYWEMRCEEIANRVADGHDADVEMPLYCT